MAVDPSQLVVLTTAAHEFEAETIAEALRAQEIPAEVFGGAVRSTMQWDIGFTDPVKIMVRRGDLGRASEVLRALRAESVDIDWDEVQRGEPDISRAPPIAGRLRWGVWALRVLTLAWLFFVAIMAYEARDLGYFAWGALALLGPAPVLLWFHRARRRPVGDPQP